MNVGEYLVSKSPLNSGTALAHLLAMQTGGVRTIFASQMTVCVEAPCLTLIQQPAFSSSRGPSETTTATQQRGKANNITVWTRLARVDVETRPSSTFVVQKLVTSCFVRTLPNTMVTQHDRSVAHI